MAKNKVISKILSVIYNKYIQEQIELNIKQYKKELREKDKEKPYNSLRDSLVPIVGGNYEILKVDNPCRFSGYIDLSNFHSGDSSELTIQFKSTDGTYKRYFRKEWNFPLTDPIITFDDKSVDGVIISFKQTAGVTGRSLLYNFRWIYNSI